MGALLLLAAAIGLATYGLLAQTPFFSRRATLVRNLGSAPAGETAPARASRLARWLRQVPATRRLQPGQFRQLQGALAVGGAVTALSPWLVLGAELNISRLALLPVLLWCLPEAWLWLQLTRRHALLARAYPDLLAHLVTQTRAGAGTYQAFAGSPPVLREPLRSEVEDLIADLSLAPFPAALGRFADRCDIPEARSFAQHVIYQHSLGISLPDVLAAEETHSAAMARQSMRRRIQTTAITMAAVTVILLLNGLLISLLPVLADLSVFLATP